MNFPTQMDQLIHDHQGARHADARSHRLARTATSGRRTKRARATRTPAASNQCGRSDAADVMMQFGAEIERLLSATLDPRTERAMADLLVRATAALEAPAQSVSLPSLTAGTPPVVGQRWLARLAERTADREFILDAARTAEVAGIVAELRSLSDGSRPAEPASAPIPARVRSRRIVPVRLSGAG